MLAAAMSSFGLGTAVPAFAYIGNIGSFDDEIDLVHSIDCFADAATVTITAEMGDLRIPKSFRHAINSPQREYWKAAIAKELAGLLELRTWDLVPASSMPPGANLMHCHYVFTVKRKKDGSIEKFKARLVADAILRNTA